MQTCSDLAKLYAATSHRLLRIDLLCRDLRRLPSGQPRLMTGYAVMELDNLVLGGMRRFLFSSLLGARTLSGHRVTAALKCRSEGEVSAKILSIVNLPKYNKMKQPASVTRDDEPTIRDPRKMEDILIKCGASNVGSVQKALQLNTNLFRDLPTLRNFYAHRNEDTWTKLRTKAMGLGLSSFQHADDVVYAVLAGRPVSLLEDWIADASIFFEELVR